MGVAEPLQTWVSAQYGKKQSQWAPSGQPPLSRPTFIFRGRGNLVMFRKKNLLENNGLKKLPNYGSFFFCGSLVFQVFMRRHSKSEEKPNRADAKITTKTNENIGNQRYAKKTNLKNV